jgi:hypothetical protein
MFYDLLGGVTKLEAFQCYFVTKLNPLKRSNMPRWKQHARGSSKARWEQHPQGERQKKALHVAHFHEIEYKLASGFTFENDSL